MIDILEFKKVLGETAKEMTEEEILKLRDQQDQEAELFFDMWLDSIKEKKSYN